MTAALAGPWSDMISEVHTYVIECDFCKNVTTVTSFTKPYPSGRMSLGFFHDHERPIGWAERNIYDGSGYGGGGSSLYLFCPDCDQKREK